MVRFASLLQVARAEARVVPSRAWKQESVHSEGGADVVAAGGGEAGGGADGKRWPQSAQSLPWSQALRARR